MAFKEMEMAQWVYDTEGLTEFSNQVKESLLSELDRHGFLRVPAEKINQEIAVVIHKPSTFGATLRKWFGVDDKTHKILPYQDTWRFGTGA